MKFILFSDDVPGLAEFKDLCKELSSSASPSLDPPLSSLLRHAFFSHDFIRVYSFLIELPIRTESEREEFFL